MRIEMQMNSIETPLEFKLIARNVAVGVLEFAKSMDDLVAIALVGIDQHHAAPVRPFLRTLLAQNMQANDLAEFWSLSPSGIYFDDGEAVRLFLAALLTKLEKEPYLTGVISN
jgi:hypothetical protein